MMNRDGYSCGQEWILNVSAKTHRPVPPDSDRKGFALILQRRINENRPDGLRRNSHEYNLAHGK